MLGALLLSHDARDNGIQLVSGADFYTPAHRFIFEAIAELHATGQAVDTITVGERLRRDDILEFCGGQSNLNSLRSDAPGYNYPWYAQIIAEHSSMRQLIHLCTSVADEAYTCPDDIADLIDRLQAETKGITGPIGKLPDGFWDIEDFRARPKEERPQWIVRGLLRELWRIVLVAEEGFGKTVLLHQISLCASRGVHPFVPKVRFEPVTTLLVDCENPEDRLDDGFEYIAAGFDPSTPALRGTAFMWTQPGGINLRTRADLASLEAIIAHIRPQIVCAGPVYKTFLSKPGESYEQVAREVQSKWDSLRTRYKFALVLEAHASKGSGGVRSMDPEGSALWLRWSEFGLKFLRNFERNGPNEDRHYDVKRFRRDRIRQHGWPSGLERSTNGMPWAARWDNADWQQYIRDDVENVAQPEPPAFTYVEDDEPF